MHEETGQEALIEQHVREGRDPYSWFEHLDGYFWCTWLGGFVSGVLFGVVVVAYHLFR